MDADPPGIELAQHALAPLAELPVLEVVSAAHFVADLTLGLGEVVHDYLKIGRTGGCAARHLSCMTIGRRRRFVAQALEMECRGICRSGVSCLQLLEHLERARVVLLGERIGLE